MSSLDREFRYMMRRSVPAPFRDLLDAATEIHVKHGLKRGEESSRRNAEVSRGPEWERLRSALMDLAREGYRAEEYELKERL